MRLETTGLTNDEKFLLTEKFREFKKARDAMYIFLVSYIADYQKFQQSSRKTRQYLRQKYKLQTPKINYLFNSGDGFYWSVRNIAAVLGRDRSSITRTIAKMKNSEQWNARLSSLQKSVISEKGLVIDVYHQDVFDVFCDYYEENYLLRFATPRHGNNSVDLDELRKFWDSLRAMESIQKRVCSTPSHHENKKIKFSMLWRKFWDFMTHNMPKIFST
ncbi:MAG: hypothetical protein IJU31_02055 [Synergistaceae bacterium]|nr:hypothetical protein [Synergistaceae bacterium]